MSRNVIVIEPQVDLFRSATDERVYAIVPDFSAFDPEPTRWTIQMGSDHNREDLMTLTFPGNPKHNGNRLSMGQPITIPSRGLNDIDMIVRSLNYNRNGSQETTTVTLATRIINLDTFIKLKLDSDNPTIRSVFDKVFSELNVKPSSVVMNGIESERLPSGKFICFGDQNLLDQLKKCLEIDGTPIFKFWFDPFNIFHVEPAWKTSNQYVVEFGPQVINYNISVRDKWEHKKQSIVTDRTNVASTPEIVSNNSGGDNRIRASTGKQQASQLKKISVREYVVTVELAGAHWHPPNSSIQLKNFPTEESTDKFILEDLIISGDGLTTTTTLKLTTPKRSINPESISARTKQTKPTASGDAYQMKINDRTGEGSFVPIGR